jgi:hypothetical protein
MKHALTRFGTLVLGTAAGPALSYHGVGGQFDLSEEFNLSGIVTDIAWVSPHAYVYFDVTTESGEVESWRCELRSAAILERFSEVRIRGAAT